MAVIFFVAEHSVKIGRESFVAALRFVTHFGQDNLKMENRLSVVFKNSYHSLLDSQIAVTPW